VDGAIAIQQRTSKLRCVVAASRSYRNTRRKLEFEFGLQFLTRAVSPALNPVLVDEVPSQEAREQNLTCAQRQSVAQAGIDLGSTSAYDLASGMGSGPEATLCFDSAPCTIFCSSRMTDLVLPPSARSLVSVSTRATGHRTLLPALVAERAQLGAAEILVVCGGVLPAADHEPSPVAKCRTPTNILPTNSLDSCS